MQQFLQSLVLGLLGVFVPPVVGWTLHEEPGKIEIELLESEMRIFDEDPIPSIDEETVWLSEPDIDLEIGRPIVTEGDVFGRGRLRFPSAHRCLTSRFGTRTDPIDGTEKWHGGIDLCGHLAEVSLAAADGVVTFAGPRGGYGLMVEITHGGGLKTVYAHHGRNFMELGDEVKSGWEVGEIGSTGRSTGAHLHFEVWTKDRKGDWFAVDPLRHIH